ncbi:unnamed protein product [Chrysodeixis includens]|uniref:STAS domain-containing protein n=1 Tax=Chrysodeixis includens TaxID=689277 RepID=A0A9N8L1R5_CHRIL|nr:unnamed protein product [Chrysodeixis includens]
MLLTMLVCLSAGLEYGILTGVIVEALLLLYNVARPTVNVNNLKFDKGDLTVVILCENVAYCAVEHVRHRVMKATDNQVPIVIDGANLKSLDFTAAFNLMSIVKDLDTTHQIILLNVNENLKKLCLEIDPRYESKFVYASSYQELTIAFTKDV